MGHTLGKRMLSCPDPWVCAGWVGIIALVLSSLMGFTTTAQDHQASAVTTASSLPALSAAFLNTGLEPTVRFQHLTADDGLAQNAVRAIVQDRHGFVWIGTEDGLSRFDGYRFTTYKHNPDDPQSLSSNDIRALFEDRDGNLWVGTMHGGVNQFDPHTQTFTRYRYDPHNPRSFGSITNIVNSIFQDAEGSLWFGGPPPNALNKFDPHTQTFTHYTPDANRRDGVRPAVILHIQGDNHGYLWLVSGFALIKFDPRTAHFTRYPGIAPEQHLTTLLYDTTGSLWVGGAAGLYRFDPHTEQWTHTFPTPAPISALRQNGDTLWISTHNRGLYRFDVRTERLTHHFRHDRAQQASLSDNHLSALYQDRSGVLWIGTKAHGLNRFDLRQTRFVHYSHLPDNAHSLAHHTVTAMAGGPDSSLWVHTGDVLNHLELAYGQGRHYRLPAEGAVPVSALYHDPTGVLWLGRQNGTLLLRFDTTTATWAPVLFGRTEPASNLPGPQRPVVAIATSKQGDIWVAVARDGLYHLDAQRQLIRRYQLPPRPAFQKPVFDPQNIAVDLISAMIMDRNDHLWIGYSPGMLSRFDPVVGRFQHYFTHPASSVGIIEMIYEDRDDTAPQRPLPTVVYADEKRLRQILLNLLGNAVKFTTQGAVTFSVVRLDDAISPTNPSMATIRFRIEDTGPGIPPEALPSLFQPFQQIRIAQTYTEGAGLGLAISQRLAQLIHSTIQVQSTLAQGSVFWLDVGMPIGTEFPAAPAESTWRIVGFAGPPRTLLVVDDNAVNRAVLRNSLARLGFIIIEAHDGLHGWELANRMQPDAILVDMRMPRLDGYALTRRLRQRLPASHLPIIAISASAYADDQQRSFDAGCDVFLPKPVDLSHLLQLLGNMLALQWRYDTPAEAPQSPVLTTAILPPPADTLLRLRHLAHLGDVGGLHEQCNSPDSRLLNHLYTCWQYSVD